MQDESSTFGLNREKLAKLWKMGEPTPEDPIALADEQTKTEMLLAQLAGSLPLEAGMVHMLPDVLTVVCEKLKPFTGCSFGALLTDPETDLLVLETIKDLYKRQAESSPSGQRKEVATAIYYAAIASALVHHDVKITKLSYQSLSRSFEELAGSDWLPVETKRLVAEAHQACVRHRQKSERGHERRG